MEGDEVVLLNFWPNPSGMRVRIALAEKGIKYENRDENLRKESLLHLKLNPEGTNIPVLIHNGKPILDSLLIVQYIDEVWKDRSPLLPSDPNQRTRAMYWADHVVNKIYENGKKVLVASKREAKENAKKEFIECLNELEEELGDKPYFGGANMGYVDVALVPYYSWFYTYEKCGNFSIEFECPKLLSWAKKCMEKKSVSQSLPEPEKIYGYVLLLRDVIGVE